MLVVNLKGRLTYDVKLGLHCHPRRECLEEHGAHSAGRCSNSVLRRWATRFLGLRLRVLIVGDDVDESRLHNDNV